MNDKLVSSKTNQINIFKKLGDIIPLPLFIATDFISLNIPSAKVEIEKKLIKITIKFN